MKTTENRNNEILEFVKSYREEGKSSTEAVVPTTIRRKKILWNRVFLAVAGLGLVVTLAVMGAVALFSKEETIKIETDSSSNTESSSVPDSKSEDSSHVKNMIVTLTDEEMTTLVLAVQHETGKDPELYLSMDERSELEALRAKNSLLTQDEANRLFNLEQFCRERFDKAQQMTAASMLNRIGKAGFGVEAETTFGARAKNLMDVLSQNSQYKSEKENLLEDIADYSHLANRDQFDPCDANTISNLNKVIYGEVTYPEDLVYQVSWDLYTGDTPAEEAPKALKEMISGSPHVLVLEYVICSYSGSDHILVFGRNDNGSGYADPT